MSLRNGLPETPIKYTNRSAHETSHDRTRSQNNLGGGPTAVLETRGVRLLTDPTFDPPGGQYASGPITLRKVAGPAFEPAEIGHIDAVLLSHDQHYVTGFVVAFENNQSRGVYVSGDTVWFEGVKEVAQRFAIGVILLFIGAARLEERGPAALTMTAADGIETARIFPSATIVPVHYHRWAHFSENRDDISNAFAEAGFSDRLRWLDAGQSVTLSAFSPEALGTHP